MEANILKTHVVIDGNAFYEIDEECLKRREKEQRLKKQQRGENRKEESRRARERKS